MMQEAEIKKELMQMEFDFNVQLQQMNMEEVDMKETRKEDRKDQRTKIQATQQSEMIEQRKGSTGPKNFESSGNDVLGGIDMSDFGPR